MESLVTTAVLVLEIYLGLGLLFAAGFAWRGVQAIDPAAVGTRWNFRVLLIPGATALWPWLLMRWIRRSPPREERNAHRDCSRVNRE